MKQSKLKQIVLPVIFACILSGCLIAALFLQGLHFTGEYEEEYAQDNDVYGEEEDSEPDHFLELDGDSFLDLEDSFTKEETEAVTELKINNLNNEEFEERMEQSGEEVSPDTRVHLDLSGLSYFPNLKKLTIYPEDPSYDEYDDNEEYVDTHSYYYTFDAETLGKLSKLEEVSLAYMDIKDLSFVKEQKIKHVTFVSCNFSETKEEAYSKLSGVSELTLEGDLPDKEMKALLQHTDSLTSLHLDGITLTDSRLFGYLKKPEQLTAVSFTITSKEEAFYKALVAPLSDVKDLSITFEIDDEDYVHKAYELPFLGEMISLEHLSLKGEGLENNLSDYVSNVVYVYHEDEGGYQAEKPDGTLYTFDLYKKQYHDYSAIGQLKNLKTLTMEQLEMTDVSFLAELTNLTSLSIAYNFVRDITAIGQLSRLEELDISFNGIQEIEALSSLTNLKKLSMGSNLISSIEAVRNMTKLESLDASSGFYCYENEEYSADKIVNAFYKDSKLEERDNYFLSHGYNPRSMEDVQKGQGMIAGYGEDDYSDSWSWFDFDTDWGVETANDYITLSEYAYDSIWGSNKNTIEDLSPLANASNLVFLDMSNNQVKDISVLKGLKKLTFLSCMKNQIEDVQVITTDNFPDLSYLYLSQNQFIDGTAIESLVDSKGNDMTVQYYMTPYYNKKELGIVTPKETNFHVEILGVDLSEILANTGTGME